MSERFSDSRAMHAQLIEKLGGGTVLSADLFGKEATSKHRDIVYKWKLNGVPWRYRPAVAELAKKKGVKLPLGFLAPAHASAPSNGKRSNSTRAVTA